MRSTTWAEGGGTGNRPKTSTDGPIVKMRLDRPVPTKSAVANDHDPAFADALEALHLQSFEDTLSRVPG
jgi:hypothetical protein